MMEDLLSRIAEQISYRLWLDIAIAVLIFLGFILLRKIFARYVFGIVFKLASKTKTDFDLKILKAFEKPLQTFIIVLGVYLALIYLPLTEVQNTIVSDIFRSFLIMFIAAGFYNLTGGESVLFDELKKKFDIDVDKILIPFFSKVTRFIIIALAITMVADLWDFPITGFITGLGLGGLAFALAAQDTIGNFLGGIIIITDKPFSIGDWVHTPTVEGTVEDISFRSTKIRTFAHAVVTVPNSTLANQSITNWTRMGKRRITFDLGVTYSTPREKIKKCVEGIREMLTSHAEIHQETIFVSFDKFSESSLDIFLYFFTKTTNWGDFLAVKEDINLKIMEILEKEGVSVAFPSRSIYVQNHVKHQQINKEESSEE